MKKKAAAFLVTVLLLLLSCPLGVFASSTVTSSDRAHNRDYVDITDAWWSSSTTAAWNIDGMAGKYEVKLYREDQNDAVASKTVTTRKVSFKDEMKKAGNYWFEVRGYNSQGGWSDWYGSEDIDKDTDTETRSSSSSSSSSSSYTNPTQKIQTVGVYALNTFGMTGWIQYDGNWCYKYPAGFFAMDSWEQIDGKWYHFDQNGWMQTGWLYLDGASYYLRRDGSMVTGECTVDGVSHYYDESGRLVR